MKDGLINQGLVDVLVDFTIMPALIAASPGGFLGWPIIKPLLTGIIKSAMRANLFDELQRVFNFQVIKREELAKNDATKESMADLHEHEQAGKTLEDPATKEAYEKWKKDVAALIRARNAPSVPSGQGKS